LHPQWHTKLYYIEEKIKFLKTAGGSAFGTPTSRRPAAPSIYKIPYKIAKYIKKMDSGSGYTVPERLKTAIGNLRYPLDILF
jgi:hypothetical protein